MARNVEIKARVRDVAALTARAAALAEAGPEHIEQDDTFFACAHGRLKLRQFSPERGQLIHYFRSDVAGPRLSDYHIVPTAAPDALRETLAAALGATGRVVKTRRLYRAGQTRIHVDAVRGLGDFVELEVVLRDDQSEDDGTRIARALMSSLGIAEADLLDVAYVDLLAATQR
ncbi:MULTISPECIES: class IV adenylate cyclase [Ralstonia solanacearum species complex]|uniref:Adenylate cyclase n=1 Tax=Ralstonia solanacearum K60 TaxID=1091042 RepID=A0AAP8D2V8_RALSL|nr:class IV adenylate cyclase [Ralstonia solanacearum]OYQ12052.1 adenylate cyclase [Ralstonia solanacearum K60]QOK82410.1 class IV adenylate cyclase [Ralstonia solanacearum]CCF96181.1 putative adenylate cyclase; CYTH family [Ralstonia solanacearum K60]